MTVNAGTKMERGWGLLSPYLDPQPLLQNLWFDYSLRRKSGYDLMQIPKNRKLISAKDIPAKWKQVHSRISYHFGETLLAGGSLSDRDHSRPIKDLDFFVEAEPSMAGFQRQLSLLRVDLGDDAEVSLIDATAYAGWFGNDTLIAVADVKLKGYPPIQICGLKKPITPELLFDFDWGMRQIGFDGSKLYRTSAYLSDSAQKQFKLAKRPPNDQMTARSLERWARIKERYDDWKLKLGPLGASYDPLMEAPNAIHTAHGV